MVGTRALGPVEYAPIGVLWTLQYLWIAVAVTALEAYVTRVATIDGERSATLRRFLRLLRGWLLAAAAGTAVVAWLLRWQLFEGIGDLALVLGLVVLAYGWYAVVRGRAAGSDRFRLYGLATIGESTIRLLAAVTVLAFAASTRALAWVFPVGPLLVAALAWRPAQPATSRQHSDTPTTAAATPAGDPLGAEGTRRGVARRFLAATSTANASVQLLLASGPLVLVPLGADAVAISVFFTTSTAARVPMTFALNGGLSRLLPPMVRMAADGDAAGLRRAARVLVVAIATAALAAGAFASLVGAQAIALVFSEGFRPDRTFVTVITISTVLAVGGLLLDQLYIAMGREDRLPIVWLAALAIAGLLVVVLPGTPTLRVAVAFAIATGGAVTALGLPLLRRGLLAPRRTAV